MRILLLATMCVVAIGCSSTPTPQESAATKETKSTADTKAAAETPAPAVYKVDFDTTKGPVVIEVHRDWAPIGADHFYTLVKSGYYDADRFFRVVPGFVVQFGLAADPAVTARWKNQNLQDDPVKQSNTVGTVTYATAGPNTRTTQLFINLADNAQLDSMGFAAFGKVISGMDNVQKINAEYGEQPDQQLIETQANAYLSSQFPRLDYIKKATIE